MTSADPPVFTSLFPVNGATRLYGTIGDPIRQLREEAERLRPKLLAVKCPVLLTPEGKLRDSEGFSRWLV